MVRLSATKSEMSGTPWNTLPSLARFLMHFHWMFRLWHEQEMNRSLNEMAYSSDEEN
jgi:hypothetical protein